MSFETRAELGKWAGAMIAVKGAEAEAIAVAGYPFAAYEILMQTTEEIRAQLQDLADRRASPTPTQGSE